MHRNIHKSISTLMWHSYKEAANETINTMRTNEF